MKIFFTFLLPSLTIVLFKMLIMNSTEINKSSEGIWSCMQNKLLHVIEGNSQRNTFGELNKSLIVYSVDQKQLCNEICFTCNITTSWHKSLTYLSLSHTPKMLYQIGEI